MASKPAAAGHCMPKPADAAGITSIAPTAGAMPTVDSSDKSNLPVSTISDSASTTSANAADAPSTLIRFALRQKARADKRADHDQQSERGQQGQFAQAREFGARAFAA